jgi:hypothetical protein
VTTKVIDKSRRWATDILRTHGLTPFREILTPSLFQQCLRTTPPPWTRLIPETVFWLMITVALSGDGAMAGAAMAFWSSLRARWPYLPAKPVTEEAFCMARRALPRRFFRRLFAAVVLGFGQRFSGTHRWRGLRLLGIDGMDFDLPHSARLRVAFPPPANQHGARRRPQARLVGLVGLHEGLCVDFRLVPLTCSEQRCARSLLRRVGPDDLLLADCNFGNYEMMARVHQHRGHFLYRLQSNRYHKVARLATPSGRRDEWYADLTIPARVRRLVRQSPETLRVRILSYQIPGFRPSRLITSLLDTQKYPYADIASLYHERWRQETHHREWKYTLTVSNLRSKSPEGILKEVFAQLTLNNVIRWIMAQAGKTKHRPVDLKFLESKRLILATIPAMAAARTDQLPRLYRALLAEIAREVILVRPGRSYPRRFDGRPRNKGHGKVSQPARLPLTKGAAHARI